MALNISKYVQLNDFLLLEYEFNREDNYTQLTAGSTTPYSAHTLLGTKQFFTVGGTGICNTDLGLQSVPVNAKRSTWYVNPDNVASYDTYFDIKAPIPQDEYLFDTVKVHIVSGYNFDDIAGFLLQLRAETSTGEMVDLSNFTWIKQVQGNSVLKFSSQPLYLGNRFYDKYVEFKIPSIGQLGGKSGATAEPIEDEFLIKALSDVYIQYSTITDINNYQFTISERVETQLPVQSNADNFNCYIAESTEGDYIEFYATWNFMIIGEYMGDIESGRIPLFTSNNPNDNFEQFNEQYGATNKWVVMHDIQVYEHIPPTTTVLSQRFQFTQEDGFMNPNRFRPVLANSDIDSSYSIDYICRLMNRMDGSQIIRKASFSSPNPKKYGKFFTRINVDNYIPYKVFNRIPGEVPNIVQGTAVPKVKYTKVFYDTTNVVLNMNNEVIPQGTGPLFLKNSDSMYKLKFEKLNTSTQPVERVNVDLSGVYTYSLVFVLDDKTILKVYATGDQNMNPTLGELTFKLTADQVNTLLQQTNNAYSIMVENPDGTKYTFYQGVYFSYSDFSQVAEQYRSLYDVDALNAKITELQETISSLEAENASLRT